MKKLIYAVSTAIFLLFVLFTRSYAVCSRSYGVIVGHRFTAPTTISGITIGHGEHHEYTQSGSGTVSVTISGDIIVDGGVLDIDLDFVSMTGNIYVKNCGILNISHSSSPGFFTFNGNGNKIYVLPSAKMSITNMDFFMSSNSFIAIESDYMLSPGASPRVGGILNLENVLFQSQSGSTWYGISVAGGNGEGIVNPVYSSMGKSQYFSQNAVPFTHEVYVGQLIANNIYISDMSSGIYNFDKYGESGTSLGNYGDFFGFCSGGGLIQCLATGGSVFRNNYGNVLSFFNYRNWQPKTSMNITYTSANSFIKDKSFIRDTRFDNQYFSGYTNRFIFLYQTDGVGILGCEFVDQPSSGSAGPNIAAVEGYESNVTVTSACNDPYLGSPYGCLHLVKSHFADMRKYGVELNNSVGSYIIGNDFTGSYGIRGVGIDMHNCIHDVILNNEIEATYTSGISLGTKVIGIAMEGCKNFWLEGNLVRKGGSSGSSGTVYGIVVNETGGGIAEKVYRNTVKWMDYEMEANGVNYSAHHGAIGGLRYICNDMSHWGSNISTDILIHDIKASSLAGVDPIQAEVSSSGFLSSGNMFADTKYAPGFHLYNPTYKTQIQYYWSSSGTNENPTLNNNINPHNTTLATCSDNTICCGVSASYSTSVPPSGGYTDYSSYLSKKLLLESKIDTADTAGVNYPYWLRQYGMLVDTMVRTFLYKDDSMMQFKGDSFFMQYVIDTLHDTVNQVYYYDTSVRYVDSSILLKYDSVMLVLDSARYDHQFKLRLAAMYRHNKDYAHAIATLNQISSNYMLANYELKDINNIIYLYSIEDSLYKNIYSYDSLSGTDTTLIGSIARDSIGSARYMAQAMLMRYDTSYLWPDVYTIDDTANKGAMPVAATSPDIKLSPNPVKNILNISLHKYGSGMTAAITDINGKKLITEMLNGNGNTEISTTTLRNGIYFEQILKDSKVKEVFKIIKD